MALTDENGGASIPATMLVGPTGYAGGYPVYQGGGNGGFGNDQSGWWIILLFLLLLGNNGWGNNGWGNNGGGNGGAGGLYPWMNQSNQINDGFRDQMLNGTVNGIQQGVNNLSTQLCNCCGDMQMALANGFAGVEQGANTRQIANMQQAFAAQTAQAQGFNAVQAQLAQCCCDNRLATTQLQAVVQQENCADRAAVSDGIRDVVTAGTANTQAVLNAIKGISDQLCQDKIDAKNETIAQLRSELMYARGQASQDVQTAAIRAGQATTANQLIQEMRSCPVPSMPVYGMTPIFNCPQNNGCGCGCNA
jgi:hypothetical protein